MPMPVFSIINGGDLSFSPLQVQEVTAMFVEASTFEEALECGSRLQRQVLATLSASGYKYINSGLAGGLAPQIETVVDAMTIAKEAAAKLNLDSSCKLGLDLCAYKLVEAKTEGNEFEEGEGNENRNDGINERSDRLILYNTSKWNKSLAAVQKSGEEMIELYFDWLGRGMGLVSLQDPFHINDDESFFRFKERLDAEIERAAAKDCGENERAQSEDAFEDPVIAFECIGNDHSCQLQIIGNSLCTTGDDMDR